MKGLGEMGFNIITRVRQTPILLLLLSLLPISASPSITETAEERFAYLAAQALSDDIEHRFTSTESYAEVLPQSDALTKAQLTAISELLPNNNDLTVIARDGLRLGVWSLYIDEESALWESQTVVRWTTLSQPDAVPEELAIEYVIVGHLQQPRDAQGTVDDRFVYRLDVYDGEGQHLGMREDMVSTAADVGDCIAAAIIVAVVIAGCAIIVSEAPSPQTIGYCRAITTISTVDMVMICQDAASRTADLQPKAQTTGPTGYSHWALSGNSEVTDRTVGWNAPTASYPSGATICCRTGSGSTSHQARWALSCSQAGRIIDIHGTIHYPGAYATDYAKVTIDACSFVPLP